MASTPNPSFRRVLGIWIIYNSEKLAAHHGLVPGETARERRHPREARLESSFYAQFPFEGSLGRYLGPLLEESLPGPPAG